MSIQDVAKHHWETRNRPPRDDWADWFWAEKSASYVRLSHMNETEFKVYARRGQPVVGQSGGTLEMVYFDGTNTDPNEWPRVKMVFDGAYTYSATLSVHYNLFYLIFTAVDGSQHVDNNAGNMYNLHNGRRVGGGIVLWDAEIVQEPYVGGSVTRRLNAVVYAEPGIASRVLFHIQRQSDANWVTLDNAQPGGTVHPGVMRWTLDQAIEDIAGTLASVIPTYKIAVSAWNGSQCTATDDNFGGHYLFGGSRRALPNED